ncbi:pentapeptide repeat-containing protein [Gimesia panareensis]|uniref:pentapeptide repeat-containing protein n=1 Tax=Gimesia panareensis TaxID=2527978 RepID=UPI0011880A0A|nr:pentapeptide repeat-containing protein [Gimesia panareensis]QDU48447.1 Secreted effector protein pipB2 [Gimesia panareensis]
MAVRKHVELVRQGKDAIAEWRSANRGVTLELSGVEFGEIDLSGADLSGAILIKSDLCGADLSGADLSGANLNKGIFRKINLSQANQENAKLIKADLRYADLSEASLINADLSGADLSNAELDGAALKETIFHNATGYSLSRNQKSRNKVKVSQFKLGKGYWILLISLAQFLIVNAPGLLMPPAQARPFMALLMLLFMGSGALLFLGFLIGSVFIANDKGYSGGFGAFLFILFVVIAYFLTRLEVNEGIPGMADSGLIYIILLWWLGPIILMLLPDRSKKRLY